jgi:hypothetical protein
MSTRICTECREPINVPNAKVGRAYRCAVCREKGEIQLAIETLEWIEIVNPSGNEYIRPTWQDSNHHY